MKNTEGRGAVLYFLSGGCYDIDCFIAESSLILIRHGESLWNEKNLFTGCCDVPLTQRGVEEAIEAGKRISFIPVDMIFTSALIRAQMTAMLAMTQHLQKKVVTPLMPVNTGILYACKIFLESGFFNSLHLCCLDSYYHP
ncbi:hypothetical protein V8G54_003318 [Vigna mungo]|uniref:phosphoglycerate mutase (2,3-diphosphoglycerate-dependent) n=1 Tax=Vigna mungo TaxID=3915 RepID=A0AAQ3SA12_VIGMU